ncbi:membrane-bound PQQ-dependent dehydrogenase, glucose/quinate/shikimate family [Sphingobium estronivorans]|uniref:membrane-bound PQQ-dependent dehydrogenase, glucose/quinate/shikimate family n=1 Tax=Sphingobium estronivorans TaxID=1577690 RepID=UPI00123A7EF4|nr:membrane-bound PQQ-dependent dehydrogenase, glucose/quinate/shikimate family [Sphingobium estronivorans]
MNILRKTAAAILSVMALFLLVLGAKLALLGGSIYYLLVGMTYLGSAFLAWRGDVRVAYVAAIVFLATVVWAFYEVGTAYWGLFPRLIVPWAVFCVSLFLFSSVRPGRDRVFLASGLVLILGLVVFIGRGFVATPYVSHDGAESYRTAGAGNAPVDWTGFSRDTFGTRFSPFDQINRDNVKNLQPVWTYRTGRNISDGNEVDQNTPLQIGNSLYACTPENAVHAIDATTGKRRWVFEAKAKAVAWARCRGLGFFRDEQATKGQVCASRIIGNTVDGRLFALDAETGALCPGFGSGGVVNLRDGMGAEGPGYYYQNSAPLIAGDKIVVGGWVSDNQMLGEPAGGLRAFDVRTGALVWAWDPGNPAVRKGPADGGSYTLGTPNMWTHAAYDPALGLIYAPMGNAGTDYYNAARPKESLKYNDALVALDAGTGVPRWSFQTTRNDLWDYDLPSQPALLDMKNDAGAIVPAVIILTKRGQIFALDRRTGTPISRVEERPVPTRGSIPENRVSPTQPYSTGMPVIAAPRFTEASSWGMTMFDQLTCRISFRRLRYDGDFTPPGLDWSMANPGALGGLNWGSASYDPAHHRLFVNDIRLPSTRRLMTRSEYEKLIKTRAPTPDGHGLGPMAGTPYGVESATWASALGVPCSQPPFGTITAIDLDTRKVAWQIPAGTAKMLGPLGIRLGLPLTPGMPSYAGTSTTAGGLVFFAGTQDYYLRALDAGTGKELWRYALPVGASATPMSYISPINGRQYVVISVGGAAHSPDVGDYIMAFALPRG